MPQTPITLANALHVATPTATTRVRRRPRTTERMLAHDYLTGVRGLDGAQAESIWARLVDGSRVTSSAAADPVAADSGNLHRAFGEHCRQRADRVETRALPGDDRRAAAYRRLAVQAPTSLDDARALMSMPKAGHRAVEHLAAQTRSVAALTGAPEPLVARRIEALRAQYASDFAGQPPSVRPEPPADWIRGFTRRDPTAKDAPSDPATLYAFYRAQGDERVFSVADRDQPTWASTDLETAAPDGPSGFQARNGHIIEVGIVVYDDSGAEIDRYERLVRPPQAFLDVHGTGRADIHHITTADLDGRPRWATCADGVRDTLDGHILLAQGARFERSWLGHHLNAVGRPWDANCLGADTHTLALQHLPDLDKHRLGHLARALGVPYTNGHRAMHDAIAAGQAFFAMRRLIRSRYAADTRFQGLPLPR